MFNEPISLSSIFLIATGAIIGSISRMLFISFFERRRGSIALSLFSLNVISTFLLGYLLAIKESLNPLQHNVLDSFLLIGFIGGFSSFSAFIGEILIYLRNRKWFQGFIFGITSVIFSLIAAQAGYRFYFAF